MRTVADVTSSEVPEQAVVALVGDHYGLYGRVLPPTTRLVEDLGADPIDLAELLITIEEVFGLTLNLEAPGQLETVADVVSLVRNSRR